MFVFTKVRLMVGVLKKEANTECPEALLVSLTGDIFEAVGGDKLKGAKKWQPYKKE
ncbi:hypothetical protein NJNGDCLN_02404 [Mannheimia haemolytica]